MINAKRISKGATCSLPVRNSFSDRVVDAVEECSLFSHVWLKVVSEMVFILPDEDLDVE